MQKKTHTFISYIQRLSAAWYPQFKLKTTQLKRGVSTTRKNPPNLPDAGNGMNDTVAWQKPLIPELSLWKQRFIIFVTTALLPLRCEAFDIGVELDWNTPDYWKKVLIFLSPDECQLFFSLWSLHERVRRVAFVIHIPLYYTLRMYQEITLLVTTGAYGTWSLMWKKISQHKMEIPDGNEWRVPTTSPKPFVIDNNELTGNFSPFLLFFFS